MIIFLIKFHYETGWENLSVLILRYLLTFQFSSVQSLSHVRLFATPWAVAHQASLSIINYQGLLKLMSIELVMPSDDLILCHPLLLLPSIFPSIRVLSNESVLLIRWPKYWSFSFNQDWFPLGWTGWISLLSKGLSRVFSMQKLLSFIRSHLFLLLFLIFWDVGHRGSCCDLCQRVFCLCSPLGVL